MLGKIKITKNFLLISLGVVLIIAGLGGNLVTFVQSASSELTGAFRFVEKYSHAAEIEGLGLSSDLNKKNNVFQQSSLESNSFFLHPSRDLSLEIPLIPEKIEIPVIDLVAPVLIAEFNFTDLEGETFGQWIPPNEYAAAWHPDSALLGKNGNTVINGHHNEFGKVFGKLVDVESGDIVYVYAKGKKYSFVIANKMIVEERGQPLEIRMQNAEWLGKTDDERLTLVTCWPEKSNTHRLILVARPY